jgi:phosphohistidine phosphatase SixA
MKILLILGFLFFNSAALADQLLLDKLKDGGYNIFFRHAITGSTYNPPGEKINDCSSQRPLNNFGRQQSIKIGKILIENQIPIGEVYSSPICRCKETARLIFGQYHVVDWLLAHRGQQQVILDSRLKESPKPKTNNVFIGHALTFSDGLLGNSWQRISLAEGEAVIIKPEFPIIIGRIKF